MVKKIALEEHFLDPATESYWRPTMVDVAPAKDGAALREPHRFRRTAAANDGAARHRTGGAGDRRARRTGGARCRHRRCGPRVHRTIFSPRKCRNVPTGIPALLILPMQDAKAAADELERCVRDLNFCGAMINGHTNGKYLDDRSYDPFWERAAALGAPIYLHPADPVAPLPVLAGHNVLVRPMWGWGVETGSHALRIICSGVFHRYPKAKLVLGHLGETLPFQLWRFDSRSKPYGWNLPKPPSQYLKENRLGDDLRHV